MRACVTATKVQNHTTRLSGRGTIAMAKQRHFLYVKFRWENGRKSAAPGLAERKVHPQNIHFMQDSHLFILLEHCHKGDANSDRYLSNIPMRTKENCTVNTIKINHFQRKERAPTFIRQRDKHPPLLSTCSDITACVHKMRIGRKFRSRCVNA